MINNESLSSFQEQFMQVLDKIVPVYRAWED